MKIVIIGATGNAGSRIAAEALSRGHSVTGISRTGSGASMPGQVRPVAGDASRPETLVDTLRGHDAIVSAARFLSFKPEPFLDAVRKSGVKRLFVVGGTASLEVAPGKILLDSPHFPAEYRAEATAGKQFLDVLRTVNDLDWTYLSPGADFAPGERTGTFRLGTDQFLTDAAGNSAISMEDFAIAALDELEHPKHIRRRFAIAY